MTWSVSADRLASAQVDLLRYSPILRIWQVCKDIRIFCSSAAWMSCGWSGLDTHTSIISYITLDKFQPAASMRENDRLSWSRFDHKKTRTARTQGCLVLLYISTHPNAQSSNWHQIGTDYPDWISSRTIKMWNFFCRGIGIHSPAKCGTSVSYHW